MTSGSRTGPAPESAVRALDEAVAEFTGTRGYLAAATVGLPPRRTVDALTADLATWSSGRLDPQCYDAVVTSTRASYARLVGVAPAAVAVGSQVSVLVSIVAAAVPDGAEVLVADGDFSSVHFPFLQRPGVRVRSVPLDRLADEIGPGTWLVAFSLVQSATGEVARTAEIREAARRHGALTLCDTTQAVGVLPVDAGEWDATVCHAYKWLCSPRGVAFLTVGDRMLQLLTPAHAGWYAGEEIWRSCYGPAMTLAADARRFDVSPAWQAWVGAEQSIGLFAGLDIAEIWRRTSALGDALCVGLGIAPQGRAVVTWPDASGDQLARLAQAGIRASGRAGRVRAAFHLWNDASDVDAVLGALA